MNLLTSQDLLPVSAYSSVYVAKNIVLMIGLDRSDKPKGGAKGEFAHIDA